MARKSRKEAQQQSAPEMQETSTAWRAAIYVRLSVEDSRTRTLSIETQQLIISRFLEQNPEISVYDTYIDNGVSGRTFHRPAFQQMLADIEAGLVNCVIVKDLSRLGRNSIDTGYYIEQYFRLHHVRFIAVNELFDTANEDDAHAGIMIPLRNMINEAYALDISRKVKAQQRQAMKDGKFVGARTPYGYNKAKDDCHQLVIDPVAAAVVRNIFNWASEGAGLNTIAVRLNEAGVLAPSHYKRAQGIITHDNLTGNGCWQTRTVSKILRAEVYVGDLVQGKTKIIDHQQVHAPADEWTVVQNTHEAIISREQFAQVQTLLDAAATRSKGHKKNNYTPNILKGKIFCEQCGGNLHRQRCPRKKTADFYAFHCITSSRVAHKTCDGVFIYEHELLPILTDMLRQKVEETLDDAAQPLDDLLGQSAERANIQARLKAKRQEIKRQQGMAQGLFENLVQGVLSRDEYFAYKNRYENQVAALNAEAEHLENELCHLDEEAKQYHALQQDRRRFKADKNLTAELIDRLVDRIEISRDKQITVHYRFDEVSATDAEVLA